MTIGAILTAMVAAQTAWAGFYTPDDYDDPGDPSVGSQELRVEWLAGPYNVKQTFEGSKESISGLMHAFAYRHSVLVHPNFNVQGRFSRIQARMETSSNGWSQVGYALEAGVGAQIPHARVYGMMHLWSTTSVKPIKTQPNRNAVDYGHVAVGAEARYPIKGRSKADQDRNHRKDEATIWLGVGAEYRQVRIEPLVDLDFLPGNEITGSAILLTGNVYYGVGL